MNPFHDGFGECGAVGFQRIEAHGDTDRIQPQRKLFRRGLQNLFGGLGDFRSNLVALKKSNFLHDVPWGCFGGI